MMDAPTILDCHDVHIEESDASEWHLDSTGVGDAAYEMHPRMHMRALQQNLNTILPVSTTPHAPHALTGSVHGTGCAVPAKKYAEGHCAC
jgi:hypothetical protein